VKLQPTYTEDEVQGFVDGQLTGEARRRVLESSEQDAALARRIQDYRMVNDALRHAFDAVAPPPRRHGSTARRQLLGRVAAAAVLFLPLGFFAGWFTHGMDRGPDLDAALAGGVRVPAPPAAHLNALLHISVDDAAAERAVLDRAEAILAAYSDQGARVEVVTNGAGLNLLRADTSKVADRVRAMMVKYHNLTFLACANTIKHLKARGIDVVLIDHADAGSTALDHIVQRLQQGWTYIKI
jgi:intracellular sulfur oxidation DsrE/DsrF family protein